jgi:hypothetical protein
MLDNSLLHPQLYHVYLKWYINTRRELFVVDHLLRQNEYWEGYTGLSKTYFYWLSKMFVKNSRISADDVLFRLSYFSINTVFSRLYFSL